MKNFCLLIFYNQSKFLEKKRDNVVTIKKIQIRNCQRFVLYDTKSIVYERDNEDWNF